MSDHTLCEKILALNKRDFLTELKYLSLVLSILILDFIQNHSLSAEIMETHYLPFEWNHGINRTINFIIHTPSVKYHSACGSWNSSLRKRTYLGKQPPEALKVAELKFWQHF